MNLAHELIGQARTNTADKTNEMTIAIDGKTICSTDKMHDLKYPPVATKTFLQKLSFFLETGLDLLPQE